MAEARAAESAHIERAIAADGAFLNDHNGEVKIKDDAELNVDSLIRDGLSHGTYRDIFRREYQSDGTRYVVRQPNAA